MPIIVFDETHNERVLLNTWTHLRDLFQRHDIDIEQYTDFPITADKIQVADIFVFGCPDGSKLYNMKSKLLLIMQKREEISLFLVIRGVTEA